MVINSSSDAQVHWYGNEGDPLLVLLHDYMGRLPWADKFARRLKAEGYRVALPDLYGGRSTTDHDDAVSLMQERMADLPEAMRVIQEIVGEARALGSQKIGLVGFSMGTRLALEYAAEHPGVDAVAAYYGAPNDPDQHIRVPILFQQGYDDLDDEGLSDAHRLRDTMVAQGFDEITVEVFDTARHGFQNEQNTEKFDAEAADAAFARTLEFLQQRLAADAA